MEYEEFENVLKNFKVEDGKIILSIDDLWKLDGVAVRNGLLAMKEIENGNECAKLLFQNFIGQRMMIEEIVNFIKSKQDN